MALKEAVEKCLNLIWSDISYLTRKKKFIPMRLNLYPRKKPSNTPPATLKTSEVVLLQTYIGRRTSRVKVGEIPPEVTAAWVIATIIMELDDIITVYF